MRQFEIHPSQSVRQELYLWHFVDKVETVVVTCGDGVTQERDILQLLEARQAVQVSQLLHQIVGQEKAL